MMCRLHFGVILSGANLKCILNTLLLRVRMQLLYMLAFLLRLPGCSYQSNLEQLACILESCCQCTFHGIYLDTVGYIASTCTNVFRGLTVFLAVFVFLFF